MKRLTLCLLAILAVGLVAADDAKPRISVLEKDGRAMIAPMPTPPYIGVLDDLGMVVQLSGGYDGKLLDWEQLRQYNLLVVSYFATLHGRPNAYDPQLLGDLLDRYLREGGGILYIGQEKMFDHHTADEVNNWLERYGAKIPWATIDDPEHAYTALPKVPFQQNHTFWTTNMADSPITSGVNTLFVRNSVFYSPYIRPLEVDENWQVIVSTMPTSQVWELTRPPGAGVAQKVEGSMREGAVPLIAVRQVGKGRLAIFGSNPAHYWYDLGQPAGAQVAWKRGDGQRASDWLPLLRNLAVWLSEPARGAGFPGGATEPVRFRIREDWGSRDPIDWERPDLSWPDSELHRLWQVHSSFWTIDDWRAMMAGQYPSFRILVGARTALSGGKGSVQDWKTAARAAGYDGVAFREDILSLTREQWEQFEADCRAATDDSFVALPGQQFADWEGNQFLRFNTHIKWYDKVRLNPFGPGVREQLHWYFDVGAPANMPLRIKGNKTPYWSYRVYSGVPVALYENGRRTENNLREWQDLVDRIEYVSPMTIHLLDDPAQVAGTVDDFHLNVIAPNLRDLVDNPRWARSNMGTGHPYCTVAYSSNGPVIEAFQPIYAFRTTLGSKGVPGSYRYRVIVRAHSDVPISLVEVWGGTEILRRYRPNTEHVLEVFDDLHERQRGVWLRLVDAKGREAYTASWNVHDKMLYLQWCGDHCNMLGAGSGIDAAGDPALFGLATHVRMRFDAAGGPGASTAEARSYIPYGTDTSTPTLGLSAQLVAHTTEGPMPAANRVATPNLRLWFCDRSVRIHRQDVDYWADRDYYLQEKHYDSSYLSGWGAYFTIHENDDLRAIVDDVDIQRDAGQLAVQLVRGTITFKRDVSFPENQPESISLGRTNWNVADQGVYFPDGPVPPTGSANRVITRGEFITWPQTLGNGTIVPLAGDLAFRVPMKDGAGTLFYGLSVPGRSFKAGESLAYSYAILRWPVGMPVQEGWDAKFVAMLGDGLPLTARQGSATAADLGYFLDLDRDAFRGTLNAAEMPCNFPLRVRGINSNWTAGVWRPGQQLLAPLAPDPEGVAWVLVDPARDAGDFFVGHVVRADQPEARLRLIRRTDGSGWALILHNPTDREMTVTYEGVAGGPVPGLRGKQFLVPGAEIQVPAGE